jgi:hypothetical protein
MSRLTSAFFPNPPQFEDELVNWAKSLSEELTKKFIELFNDYNLLVETFVTLPESESSEIRFRDTAKLQLFSDFVSSFVGVGVFQESGGSLFGTRGKNIIEIISNTKRDGSTLNSAEPNWRILLHNSVIDEFSVWRRAVGATLFDRLFAVNLGEISFAGQDLINSRHIDTTAKGITGTFATDTVGEKSIAVTFDAAFSVAPVVIVGLSALSDAATQIVSIRAESISTTEFTAFCRVTVAGGAGSTGKFAWVAFGN